MQTQPRIYPDTGQAERLPFATAQATGHAYLDSDSAEREMQAHVVESFGLQFIYRSDHGVRPHGLDTSAFFYRITRGKPPQFTGSGLRIQSHNEFERLATIPDTSAICTTSYPGVSDAFLLTDPSGNIVEAISGPREVIPLPHRAAMPLNPGSNIHSINITPPPKAPSSDTCKISHPRPASMNDATAIVVATSLHKRAKELTSLGQCPTNSANQGHNLSVHQNWNEAARLIMFMANTFDAVLQTNTTDLPA